MQESPLYVCYIYLANIHQQPFTRKPSVDPTSQQVYDSVCKAEGDRLGAGDAGAATRDVLRCYTEQTAVIPS